MPISKRHIKKLVVIVGDVDTVDNSQNTAIIQPLWLWITCGLLWGIIHINPQVQKANVKITDAVLLLLGEFFARFDGMFAANLAVIRFLSRQWHGLSCHQC